ncbi:pilus assembly protein [Salinisphaera hydrothermalis]|uniref:pilus assembly protein n=1 Tax=Salinisphaera hydrothermalis TaxID=563188 RepID=UPI00333F88C3
MRRQHARIRIAALALLVALALAIATPPQARAASGSAIDLTDQPVVTGSSLAPNILVAVDNSGSMDFETLFPTDNGLLFWDGRTDSAWENGHYVQDSNISYAYLFPNGYNNCSARGGCNATDRRIYSGYYAVPPIPVMAFARSPQYNHSYFNPAVTYKPWINKPEISDFTHVPSSPVVDDSYFDLTQDIKTYQDGYNFAVIDGMPFGDITYADSYHCTKPSPYGCYSYEPYWQTSSKNYVARGSELVGIEYFPATFYLDKGTDLPPNYGYVGRTLQGYGPNKENLTGYEIKPNNFATQAQYQAAMQNFANWFTYYRKRSLAIRGGITSAFDKIGRVRVGSCTITEAQDRLQGAISGAHYLTMTSLPEVGDNSDNRRRDFYESIYGMDFSRALGTPNRPALYYLGRELENNPDIIQSPCQRNYALLFTDGYNNGALPSNASLDPSNDGDVDGDHYTNTIADIAMHFYKDLTPPKGISDSNALRAPEGCPEDKSLDCVTKPHMTTFGITLGQQGYIFGNTDAYPAANSDPYNNPPPWYAYSSNPNAKFNYGNLPTGGPQEIDDLWHATINSRGALLNANSPEKLADKFTNVLNQILGRGETLTNATGNSTSLTANSEVFQTQYETTHWTGDLIAFNALNGSTAQSDRLWSAASLLTGVTDPNASDGRTIVTALRTDNASTSGAVSGVPFTSTGLSSSGIASLTPAAIAYLRGHRDKEQTGASSDASNGRIYRQRGDTVLGDIINSVPTYVGAPNPLRYAGTWKDLIHPNSDPTPENQASYYDPGNSTSFVSKYASRPPMVYVGANDGMLHGFYAGSDSSGCNQPLNKDCPGQEWLAYIPNTLLGSLAGGNDPLTSPSYAHRSFVDGQIATGPAFFDGQWHTMLVGGLRNGGDTIYGLDVTDPSTFSQSNAGNIVRWEFKAPGLGKTFGKPSIVRLHNGEWAAIFANGYNSDNYGASLYVVDIADGHEIAHLTTGATPTSGQPGNGLATPFPVDIDGDHITDYVYAGDLYGNVWRFDLTSTNPDDWSDQKIFQATAANGSAQPITTQVQVAAHPNGVGYGVMVYFGTGQDIQPLNDNQSAIPNSFYGIWDPNVIAYNPGNNAPARPTSWSVSRDQLVAQSVGTVKPDNAVNGLSYRTVTDNPITYIDNNGKFADRGWVIDLPTDSGEAVLNPPSIVGDNVEFTTTVINRQTCSLTSSGYFMAVSRVNGGPAAKNIFDVNGDGIVNEQDASTPRVAGIGFGSESGSPGQGPSFNDLNHGTQVIKTPLTGGGTATITLARDFLNGRRSWHEIRR